LEASVANAQWLNPGLAMNGTNSVVTLPANPILERSAPWSLDVAFTLAALPTAKSAFIAGDRSSAWLEVYPNGQLCAYALGAQGPQNVCTTISLNTPTDATVIVTPSSIALSINGSTIGSTSVAGVPAISSLAVGSAGPTTAGYYGAWQGKLSRLSFYDYAIH
jgi:hypothetical protein